MHHPPSPWRLLTRNQCLPCVFGPLLTPGDDPVPRRERGGDLKRAGAGAGGDDFYGAFNNAGSSTNYAPTGGRGGQQSNAFGGGGGGGAGGRAGQQSNAFGAGGSYPISYDVNPYANSGAGGMGGYDPGAYHQNTRSPRSLHPGPMYGTHAPPLADTVSVLPKRDTRVA